MLDITLDPATKEVPTRMGSITFVLSNTPKEVAEVKKKSKKNSKVYAISGCG
jgi:hypothetical protein